MIIVFRSDIAAPPEEVWSYISDPEKVRKWHGGIRAIVPVSAGEWTAGSRWRVRYEFRGRESNYLAEVLEFEKPTRLVIHLTGGDMPVNGYLQEVYELSSSTRGTLLKQRIVLYKYRTNFLTGGLIFLSQYLVRPRMKKYLLKLKGLAEGEG